MWLSSSPYSLLSLPLAFIKGVILPILSYFILIQSTKSFNYQIIPNTLNAPKCLAVRRTHPPEPGQELRQGVAVSPRSTRSNELFRQILRALQFLSAVTSLIVFFLRPAKILRLVHKASRSNGAVEGIIAAAVLYTLVAILLSLGLRAGGPCSTTSNADVNGFFNHLISSDINCKLPWGAFILAIIST